jgi:hypothetical protein
MQGFGKALSYFEVDKDAGRGKILKKEGEMMDWGLFGQLALLIIIFVFAKTVIKCFHDNFCIKCKK